MIDAEGRERSARLKKRRWSPKSVQKILDIPPSQECGGRGHGTRTFPRMSSIRPEFRSVSRWILACHEGIEFGESWMALSGARFRRTAPATVTGRCYAETRMGHVATI